MTRLSHLNGGAGRIEDDDDRRFRSGSRDPIIGVMAALVRPGDVVVDIGANWGRYASRLAEFVGAVGHVHAFEPDPSNAQDLDGVLANYTNVTVYHVALSDRIGEGQLRIPVFGGERVGALASLSRSQRPKGPHEVVAVGVERLDAVLPGDGPPVAFVKCDVEGHESAVLRGAGTVLRRSRPALLIEIEQRHRADDIHGTFADLARLGYTGYALYRDGLQPLADFDVHRDQLAFVGPDLRLRPGSDAYVHDFLFVRPETDITSLMGPR